MNDDLKILAVAWAVVLVGLIVGYFTDPIPCSHPAQTGCGYDAGLPAVLLVLVLIPLTYKRFRESPIQRKSE